MKAPRSLRRRLTAMFTGLAAVGVLASAGSMVMLVEYAVWGPLDAALGEEAETLASLGEASSAEDLATAVAHIGREPAPGPGKFIRVVASDGSLIAHWRKDACPGTALGVPRPSEMLSRTVERGDRTYRVVRYGAPHGGWVEVGVRAERQVTTLRRARLGIGGSAAALLAALALLAWTITTRATTELERLAAELETVEAGSLDRRLAQRRTTEVDRLVVVLNRLLARLEGAMDHLRRFTADAAHELRTPVAALRAHIEATLAREASAEAYRDGLLDALQQAERLGRLAADLLTLSAVESEAEGVGDEEPVRLDALVREVAEFLEPVAQEQGRHFTCEAGCEVAVRGSAGLLKRMVLNLVDNAFQHTPSTAAVALAVGTANGTATLEVRDEGPGISPEDFPLVFERFRRGRSPTAGSGLGLALAREIAARYRGQIALRSTPGAGTTVTVTLPLA